MSNNKSIRITVASCLLIVSMVAGLFVYSTISPKELTAEEYKQIGFYKLVRTRQINNFKLIEGDTDFSNNDLISNSFQKFRFVQFLDNLQRTKIAVRRLRK